MRINGQVSTLELMTLFELSKNLPSGQAIVEIGSYQGRSTIALAKGSLAGNDNPVYAVEPHEEFVGLLGGSYGPQDRVMFFKNLLAFDVANKVALLNISSGQASKCWEKINIGMVFIDGDHSYDQVKEDFFSWRRYLLVNAIVCFHDIKTSGVSQLITELSSASQIIKINVIENLGVFRYIGKL